MCHLLWGGIETVKAHRKQKCIYIYWVTIHLTVTRKFLSWDCKSARMKDLTGLLWLSYFCLWTDVSADAGEFTVSRVLILTVHNKRVLVWGDRWCSLTLCRHLCDITAEGVHIVYVCVVVHTVKHVSCLSLRLYRPCAGHFSSITLIYVLTAFLAQM